MYEYYRYLLHLLVMMNLLKKEDYSAVHYGFLYSEGVCIKYYCIDLEFSLIFV